MAKEFTEKELNTLRVLFVSLNEAQLAVLSSIASTQKTGQLTEIAPHLITGIGRSIALSTLILRILGLSNEDMKELGEQSMASIKEELQGN